VLALHDIFRHHTSTKVYGLDPINQYNDNGDYIVITGGATHYNLEGSMPLYEKLTEKIKQIGMLHIMNLKNVRIMIPNVQTMY
jgi:hypothetical protein